VHRKRGVWLRGSLRRWEVCQMMKRSSRSSVSYSSKGFLHFRGRPQGRPLAAEVVLCAAQHDGRGFHRVRSVAKCHFVAKS
jgi:hypothetical protein